MPDVEGSYLVALSSFWPAEAGWECVNKSSREEQKSG
jgi:hypothetical protein